MIYRWSCEALDGSDNNCLEDGSALAPSIIVHGADLIEGKSYKYTVTIEKSGRTAADSKVVTVHKFNLQLICNLFKTQHFSNVQVSIFQRSLLSLTGDDQNGASCGNCCKHCWFRHE